MPGISRSAEERAGLLEASMLLVDIASLPQIAQEVLPLLYAKVLTVELGARILRSPAGPAIVEFLVLPFVDRLCKTEDAPVADTPDAPMAQAQGNLAPCNSEQAPVARSAGDLPSLAASALQESDLADLELAIKRYLSQALEFRSPAHAEEAGSEALVAPLRASLLELPLARVVDLLYYQLHAIQVAASAAGKRQAPTGPLRLIEEVRGTLQPLRNFAGVAVALQATVTCDARGWFGLPPVNSRIRDGAVLVFEGYRPGNPAQVRGGPHWV